MNLISSAQKRKEDEAGLIQSDREFINKNIQKFKYVIHRYEVEISPCYKISDEAIQRFAEILRNSFPLTTVTIDKRCIVWTSQKDQQTMIQPILNIFYPKYSKPIRFPSTPEVKSDAFDNIRSISFQFHKLGNLNVSLQLVLDPSEDLTKLIKQVEILSDLITDINEKNKGLLSLEEDDIFTKNPICCLEKYEAQKSLDSLLETMEKVKLVIPKNLEIKWVTDGSFMIMDEKKDEEKRVFILSFLSAMDYATSSTTNQIEEETKHHKLL